MEKDEVLHQPCLTELSEDQRNEPVTQIIVLKAKKKKKKSKKHRSRQTSQKKRPLFRMVRFP